MCLDLEKVVLEIKSIVMRTTNNLFRKVHNYTHFKGWFTQCQRRGNILEIFHYFQYFERFRSMKKWQISKPKIVDWYLDFSKESYTTLKSVISSFKICFQIWAFWLSGPMLKTRKNTIRNQFQQQWFKVISFQKRRRVYLAIWYNLKPFANKRGRLSCQLLPSARITSDCQRAQHCNKPDKL